MENDSGYWALINLFVLIIAYIFCISLVWQRLIPYLIVSPQTPYETSEKDNSFTQRFKKNFLVYFFEDQLPLSTITIEKVNTFFLIITTQEAIQSIFQTQKENISDEAQTIWVCVIFPSIGLACLILQKLYFQLIYACYDKFCYNILSRINQRIDKFSSYDPRPKIPFALGFILTNLMITVIAYSLDQTNAYFSDLLRFATIASAIQLGIEIIIAIITTYLLKNNVKSSTYTYGSPISQASSQKI